MNGDIWDGGRGGRGREFGEGAGFVSSESLIASAISSLVNPEVKMKGTYSPNRFRGQHILLCLPFFLKKAFFWSEGLFTTLGLLRNFIATSTCRGYTDVEMLRCFINYCDKLKVCCTYQVPSQVFRPADGAVFCLRVAFCRSRFLVSSSHRVTIFLRRTSFN